MSKNKVHYLKKLEIISKINTQGLTVRSVSHDYNISVSTIKDWLRLYDSFGISGLVPGTSIKYPNEIKMKAIEDILVNHLSKADVLKKYKITQNSVLNHWIKRYNNDKTLKQRGVGVRKMNKGRITTFIERIAIVKEIIASDFNYQALSEQSGVSYQQSYSWTQKYKAHGEQGLQDRRGKSRSSDQQLTETEQLKIENKALKAKNELLEIENQLAKKLLEFEKDVTRSL
ncbi:helix-turn-helix domain-containing protein [Leuconostoc carnosum]|uniref:Helix-turn-helix domain-containing protein n=1 Tax=Leuconostoc carnosum TaxID=1252 RepID=A0AAE6IJ15_LEUCA|nr:helix-turn-helix domain-containing protein [Leuconostoc carnosum]QEA33190.1 helix-turn-helix domain-containing protein [Leuconostoc carnosum]